MKITAIKTFRAHAGWRLFSFLKVETSSGIVGWAEYNESFGSSGLSSVIESMVPLVLGRDPRRIEEIVTLLQVNTRQSRGGIMQQAIAAIENGLLDVKGKDLGVPVHALLGGALRDSIPFYWSHAGTYRTPHYADHAGLPRLKSHDGLRELGEEARARGYRAVKTNLLFQTPEGLDEHTTGFGRKPGWPELNADNAIVQAAVDTVAAWREGLGPEIGLMLDINFNFKTEGFSRIAAAVEPYRLEWLELDCHDAQSVRLIRDASGVPIASGETLCHRRDFKPFLELYAMDVCLIDVIWNGVAESVKIANMAEIYEMNVAPHNFYGHLSTAMNVHFCAVVPNLRIMETDIDSIPWRDEFVTALPEIRDGNFVVPDAPGWGIDIDEAAVARHAPRT